jgi:hypothetical protein
MHLHRPITRLLNRIAGAIIILTSCLFLVAAASHAAAAPVYTFSQEAGTYEELQNASPVSIPFADTVYQLDLHGEVFSFFHKPFTITGNSSFEIADDGFLRVWDDSTVMVVDGLFTPLDSLGSTSHISYALEGSAGDHVLKIQWKNVGFHAGQPTDFANFQIWVYQKSGVIEIRMGQSEAAGTGIFPDGPWIGAFISPSSFSAMTEKVWITGDPAKPSIDRAKNFQFKKIASVPAAGTIYRLTPSAASGVGVRDTRTGSLWLW